MEQKQLNIKTKVKQNTFSIRTMVEQKSGTKAHLTFELYWNKKTLDIRAMEEQNTRRVFKDLF